MKDLFRVKKITFSGKTLIDKWTIMVYDEAGGGINGPGRGISWGYLAQECGMSYSDFAEAMRERGGFFVNSLICFHRQAACRKFFNEVFVPGMSMRRMMGKQAGEE